MLLLYYMNFGLPRNLQIHISYSIRCFIFMVVPRKMQFSFASWLSLLSATSRIPWFTIRPNLNKLQDIVSCLKSAKIGSYLVHSNFRPNPDCHELIKYENRL